MSSSPSLCKEEILAAVIAAGAFKAGVAEALPVDSEATLQYERWIADGRHAGMDYMTRYDDVRRDPRLLLDGARSIISAAFPYYNEATFSPDALRIARYALGDDYHEVVRRRLQDVAARIAARTGADCRVTVDTAPLRERYTAVKAGLGFIGRNNMLIIPGAGSYFFLGEIITTLPLPADSPMTGAGCGNCRRCIDACPGNALDGQSGVDARRCLSYLTIEHRGDFHAGVAIGKRLYGCDECQDVCPYNRHPAPSAIPEFKPRPALLSLSRDNVLDMEQAQFSAVMRHSAIKRAKLDGLRRNANNCDS